MNRLRRLTFALAFVGLRPLLAAGQAPRREVFTRDSTANMYKLAEGVSAITHASATPDRPHGNTGVIVGTEGVPGHGQVHLLGTAG